MEFENIIVSVENSIEHIVLNRPKVLNALNIDTVSELREAVEYAAVSDEVRVVIISGAGGRAFAAGADIAEMRELTPEGGREMIANGKALMREIELLDKPVIAALNGYVIGGGLELALACDIRIASASASFSFPEPSLGIIPGYGGSQRLGRVIGYGMAKYYCLTEERMDAARAYELGLVAKVLDTEEELMSEAYRIAGEMLKRSPAALAAVKESIREGMSMDMDSALMAETRIFDRVFSSEERVVRMGRFLEGRKNRKRS